MCQAVAPADKRRHGTAAPNWTMMPVSVSRLGPAHRLGLANGRVPVGGVIVRITVKPYSSEWRAVRGCHASPGIRVISQPRLQPILVRHFSHLVATKMHAHLYPMGDSHGSFIEHTASTAAAAMFVCFLRIHNSGCFCLGPYMRTLSTGGPLHVSPSSM